MDAWCMCAKSLQSCLTFYDPMDCILQAPLHMAPGKNTGVGCHALLQGIFPTQGSKHLSLMSIALAGGFFTISATGETLCKVLYSVFTSLQNNAFCNSPVILLSLQDIYIAFQVFPQTILNLKAQFFGSSRLCIKKMVC